MIAACLLLLCQAGADADWPAFRGDGTSVSAVENVPLTWSDTENLAWATDLPCYGQSSPVVWNGSVFVTGIAGDSKEKLLVVRLDLSSGKIRWQREFDSSSRTAVSDYISKAAPTPAVDADRVYAFFESGDFIALDHSGETVWQRRLTKEFGEFLGNHGVGGSPAATDDSLFLLIDHDGPSYLLGIDKQTGRDRWKVDRKSRISWTSPIVTRESPPRVIVSSAGDVEAFDATSGERVWIYSGVDGNTVASPTPVGDRIVVGSSKVGEQIALPRDGKGEIPASAVLWRSKDVATSFDSPLAFKNLVFSVSKAGVGACLDLKTGETLWQERGVGSCWASPIGVADRVYFFGKDGATTVVAAESEYRKLAENRLTIEGRLYGVAVVPRAFIVRTGKKLLCVGSP